MPDGSSVWKYPNEFRYGFRPYVESGDPGVIFDVDVRHRIKTDRVYTGF